MSAATRSATSNSLILLDEFGKGTETVGRLGALSLLISNDLPIDHLLVKTIVHVSLQEDGLALLCSCLKFWLKKYERCPHVFVSTHFHSLVSRHLLPECPLLKYQVVEFLYNHTKLAVLKVFIGESQRGEKNLQ